MEKHTVDDMKSLAAERGGRFVSEEYLGIHVKHTWECARGHRWDTIPSRVKQGTWCPICGNKRKGMDVDGMKSLAAERGGRFVSEEYLGSHVKHTWECARGHRWDAIPSNVNQGSWCPICGNKRKGRSKSALPSAQERPAAQEAEDDTKLMSDAAARVLFSLREAGLGDDYDISVAVASRQTGMRVSFDNGRK